MADEVRNINEVKTTSDGTVTIAVEKYEKLLSDAARPQTINRTQVVKTAEMLAREYRVWGGAFMGLGGSLFVVGAFLFRAGSKKL